MTTDYQLAKDLEQAFNQIGTSMMNDEFAAKLLAWVYVCGGGNEAVVMHKGLNAGIGIAQQKFNINGGEIPNAEGVRLINKYIKELEHAEKKFRDFSSNQAKYVLWVGEIYKRYELKTPKPEPKTKSDITKNQNNV